MDKLYYLNPGNGKIHIMGYCYCTKPCPKEWKAFSSEEEAREFYGIQSSGLCKLCLRKQRQLKK